MVKQRSLIKIHFLYLFSLFYERIFRNPLGFLRNPSAPHDFPLALPTRTLLS